VDLLWDQADSHTPWFREGSPDHTSALASVSRERAVESYIFGTQPRVQKGHHQRGGKTLRCKRPRLRGRRRKWRPGRGGGGMGR